MIPWESLLSPTMSAPTMSPSIWRQTREEIEFPLAAFVALLHPDAKWLGASPLPYSSGFLLLPGRISYDLQLDGPLRSKSMIPTAGENFVRGAAEKSDRGGTASAVIVHARMLHRGNPECSLNMSSINTKDVYCVGLLVFTVC